MDWYKAVGKELQSLTRIKELIARIQSQGAFIKKLSFQGEKAYRDELVIEYGQLQLERGAWAAHGRVEKIARERLAMRLPRHSEVILLKKH